MPKSKRSSNKKTKKPDMHLELDKMKQDFRSLGLSEKKPKPKNSNLIKHLLYLKSINQFFSFIGKAVSGKYPKAFKSLDIAMESSDMETPFEEYLGKMIILPFISMFITLIIIISGTFFNIIIPGFLLIPPAIFLLTFIAIYCNPFRLEKIKKTSIDSNLPFALNHLAAIASSGAPPEKAFEILSKFREFGGVAKESSKIIEIIRFGEDITTAISHIIKITPSEKFKGILEGILTVTETGGNLEAYLKQAADVSMHDYRLSQNQYTESLSTYADIYTAILIAAPLFMISILAVMNIIPSTKLLGGYSIPFVLTAGVYVVVPVLNILFIFFINMTQQEM